MSLKYALDGSETEPTNNTDVLDNEKTFILNNNQTDPEFDENNIKNEDELSQDDLRRLYRREYPHLFDDDGTIKVETQDKAVELGIINKPVISVPIGDETPSPFRYNQFSQQSQQVKNNIEVDKKIDMSNVDKFALKPDVDKQMSDILQTAKNEETDMTDAQAWTQLFNSMRGGDDVFNEQFQKSSKKEQGQVRSNFYLGTILSTLDEIGLGDDFLKGTLHLERGLKFTGFYIQDKYEGLHKGLDEMTDGEFSKLIGFNAKTGGRKFVGDIVDALTVAEGLPATSGITAGVGTLRRLSKGLAVLPSEVKKVSKSAFAKPDYEQMVKSGALIEETRGKANPLGLISRTRLVTPDKAEREKFKLVSEQIGRQIAIERGEQFGVASIKEAIANAKLNKSKAADSKASKSSAIAVELIDAFEKEAGVVISKVDETTGKKTLDFEKARVAGEETTQRIAVGETTSFIGQIPGVDVGYGKKATTSDLADIATGTDELFSPILNPEKFNPLIAVVADLKEANPNLFGKKKGNHLIDDLFELTVKKDLIADDELLTLLNKYGLNIEEYVMLVVGSGSKAGKVLNKLSQARRTRPKNEIIEIEQKAIAEIEGTIGDYARRIENIRRGGLVSQIATAARNVWSMGMRMPAEALGNIADTAVYSAQKAISEGSIKPIFSTSYKHSFSMLKYVYTGVKSTRVTAQSTGRKTGAGLSGIVRDTFLPEGRELNMTSELEEMVNIILKDPKFAEQFKIMFGTVQEIQQSMGKGTPKNSMILKGLDVVVDGYEDFIQMINTPNRMQEFLMRRSVFLGETQRLLQREWGVDLLQELRAGKLLELINDTNRPKDASSFIDIVAKSTNRAIDVTYAKKPETALFKEINRFLTRLRIGPLMIGTILAPFPRFMFNNMELMGQYAAGATYPMTRKFLQLMTKSLTLGRKGKTTPAQVKTPKGKVVDSTDLFRPLTEKDRERISRNMVGWAALYTMYEMMDEESPADYKKIQTTDDTVLDTSPLTPIRPLRYFAKGGQKFEEGFTNSRSTSITDKIQDGINNVMEWTDAKEFIETVAGVNAQRGIGSNILQEIMDFTGANDLVKSETTAKTIGRFFGELYATLLVPFKQVKDLERATGFRTTEIKEYGKDPNLDFYDALFESFMLPSRRMGFYISPEDEMKLPTKVFPFRPKGVDERRFPALKFLGFTLTTANTEDGEFIERLGFSDYKISSRSKVPSIKAVENEIFQEHLGVIVKNLRAEETILIEQGYTKPEIRTKLRNLANKQMQVYNKKLGSKKSLMRRLEKDTDETIYLLLAKKFRRLQKDSRKAAMIEWKRNNPDTDFIASNVKHLEDVLIEAFTADRKAKMSTGLMDKQEISDREIQQYLYGPILRLQN